MNIRPLATADHPAWLALRAALWPQCATELEVTERHEYFSADSTLVTFVAEETDGQLSGFLEASLRPSAEGCFTKPVGYLEGIYVLPDFRRRGVARALVAFFRKWARSHHCTELASDCLSDNEASLAFHRNVGFAVVSQLVHFQQTLATQSCPPPHPPP